MGRWVPHFVADAGWLKTVSQTGVEALVDLHHAQAPAVLDHSCTLPQCDGQSGRVIRQKREPRPACGKGGVSGTLPRAISCGKTVEAPPGKHMGRAKSS